MTVFTDKDNSSDKGNDEHLLNRVEELIKLGISSYNNGRFRNAISHYKDALNIQRNIFGDNHSEVAKTYNNLAELNRNIGDYAQAEDLYKKALEIQLNLFGDNHSEVAKTYNNLAELNRNIGDYAQAEDLYKKALEILQNNKLQSDENKSIFATVLNNMGEAFFLLR